jgi:renal tumor antigen
MDMWGVGCVYFEIVTLFPLFPGDNELDQIAKIHNVLGSPQPEIINQFKKYFRLIPETLLILITILQINRD